MVSPLGGAILLLGSCVALLAGCAGVAEVTGTATQQDLIQLRADVSALQTTAARARAETDTASAELDRRVKDQLSESERQTAALTRRLDGLATTLTALSTRIDELAARVDTLARQVRASATPPRPPAPAPGATVVPTPPPAAPLPAVPSRPTTGALQPQDIYQAAYLDFSKGSYSLAIAGFREFLRRYPEHELANNAQYWIGEAYLSLARGYANAGQGERASESLEQAVQEFKKVLANYPRGDKTPTALYKEALALIDLKQPALAQARLQYLVENFPQAVETPLARERLAALRAR